MKKQEFAVYEVANQSIRDINLDDQISLGINDWCAEDSLGRSFYGRTKADAEKTAMNIWPSNS